MAYPILLKLLFFVAKSDNIAYIMSEFLEYEC